MLPHEARKRVDGGAGLGDNQVVSARREEIL
jgi:hypothetical protein